MSFMKRLKEKVDFVVSEMEAICIENEHDSGEKGPRVCSDCALAIEIMESEFEKLGSEIGSNHQMA